MRGRAHIATDDEAAWVGRVLAAGFSDDPVLTWVFQGPDQDAKIGVFFDFLAREALVPLGATYCLGDCCAAWTPPDPAPWPPERGERFTEALNRACDDDDLARLGVLGEITEAHHPSGSYWYLGVIGTVPASRGQGLGGRILEQSLIVLDETGLPGYLESTNPRNVSLYERHGFVAREGIELPDGPTLTAMWRPPRGS